MTGPLPDFSKLTRRADPDRAETWLIYCGDICAGRIAMSVGRPNAQNEWVWSAGFYPGSRSGEIRNGSAITLEEAKEKFQRAWLDFASSRTEADFAEWRDQRDFTAWKYQMRDHGMPLPTQSDTGRARCFCGAEITIASANGHIRSTHSQTPAG